MGYGFGGWGMGPWLWGGWLWGGLLCLAFVALLVWAVVAFTSSGHRRPADEEPVEILKRRFARGEITEAEFEQARRRLAA